MSRISYEDTKLEIMNERGWLCECGCRQQGHDLHHGLIHNIKKNGVSKYPILNDKRNLFLVNHWQHTARMFDTQEWRKYFWKMQIKRYGEAAMLDWIENLPSKLKSTRLDFIERN